MAHVPTAPSLTTPLGLAPTVASADEPIVSISFDAQVYLIHPAKQGCAPAPRVARRFQRVWLEP